MSITPTRGVLLLSIIMLVYSCHKHNKTAKDTYENYIVGNKEWKSKKVSHSIDLLSYTATEVPIQYYILKNGSKKDHDSAYIASSRERIIEIEFEHQDGKDVLLEEFTRKAYEDSVKYMSFFIEKDFEVVTESNDTIKCAGVNFERNYNVAPFKRILLYFNNINPNENIRLIYNDVLFGNGIIEFNFVEQPLKL
ncbi:MAG: hypothetical protein AAFX55_12755 [Bacteroidota bacterium]